VMGLSKALSERIVETMAREASDTRLMSVRFGNVLGSSGSVVPLFKRQIAAGGPVTVTDERMTRFFMTIPEAVRLVIQTGAIGNGGEIFVLDMGDPVRIVDLAREMIRLSGLELGRDIEIVFTGNRGGEKLDEKLFNDGEQVVGTSHPKIAMAARRPLPRSLLRQELARLREALDAADVDEALRLAGDLVRVVPPAAPAGATPVATPSALAAPTPAPSAPTPPTAPAVEPGPESPAAPHAATPDDDGGRETAPADAASHR